MASPAIAVPRARFSVAPIRPPVRPVVKPVTMQGKTAVAPNTVVQVANRSIAASKPITRAALSLPPVPVAPPPVSPAVAALQKQAASIAAQLKLMRSTPFAPFSLMVLLQQREQALQQQIAAASRAAPIPPVVVAQSAVTQRLAPPISIRGTLVPGTATRSVLAPVVTGPVLPGALLPVSSGSVPAALANTVASSTTAPAQAMIPGDVASPGLFYGGGSSVSSPSSGVSGPAVTSGASSNSLLWIGGAAVIVFMLSRGRH